MDADKIDMTILAELSTNARISHTELSNRMGLSSTAIARRQRALEEEGYITAYQAVLDLNRFGLSTTVLVRVALDSQSDEALKLFETAVVKCPSVIRCFLMSGSDDYLLRCWLAISKTLRESIGRNSHACRTSREFSRVLPCARSSIVQSHQSFSENRCVIFANHHLNKASQRA